MIYKTGNNHSVWKLLTNVSFVNIASEASYVYSNLTYLVQCVQFVIVIVADRNVSQSYE